MKTCSRCGTDCPDFAFACECSYEFRTKGSQVVIGTPPPGAPKGSLTPTLDTFKLGTYIVFIGVALAITGGIIIALNLPVTVAPQKPAASGWQAQMLQGINSMAEQMDSMDETMRREVRRAAGIKWLIAGAIVGIVGLAVPASSVKPLPASQSPNWS